MKPFHALLTTLLLAAQTLWAAPGKLQNTDFKTPAQLTAAGAPLSQLLNDSKIWVTANGINQQLSSAIQSGLIGGGAGQNLVSNGSFEASGVSGWSTFSTTLAAAPSLAPTTAPATCTSCTFAIGAQTAGALDGATSLQLTGASTTTPGQGFISNVFTVAPVYRGQVMSIKGVFGVVSGLAALNLSGTSSNSFAVYIYDVTNATWIQPNGTYGLASNGGPFAPISFQVPSNTTQMQLAIVNVNALAGATVQLFDDLTVAPAVGGYGLAGTDEIQFTPIIETVGGTNPTAPTFTTNLAYWSRVGPLMHIHVTQSWAAAGTAGNGCYTLRIPGGYSADLTKRRALSTQGGAVFGDVLGEMKLQDPSNNAQANAFLASATNIQFNLKYSANNATAQVTDGCWSQTLFPYSQANGVSVGTDLWVPIAGWSSNVSQSSDFDGRPTLFTGSIPSATITPTAALPLTTIKDAAGAWSVNTFNVPTAGDYSISGTIVVNTGPGNLQAYVNGVLRAYIASNPLSGQARIPLSATLPNLKTGDQVQIRSDYSVAVTAAATDTISIVRVPGSSPVVQNGSTIAARYTNTAGTSFGSTPTMIPFATKDFDRTQAWTGTQFNCQTAGTYTVNALLNYPLTASTAGFQAYMYLYKNGVSFSMMGKQTYGTTNATGWYLAGSDMFSCVQGDYFQIYAQSDNAVSLSTTAGYNHVQFLRVGN